MAASAAELTTLSPDNWDRYVPQGKEVDAIYGDYVLRNDKLIAVIGRPGVERHANLTVKNVGGALLDLTPVDAPNDQLSAYYPGASRYSFVDAGQVRAWVNQQIDDNAPPRDDAGVHKTADPSVAGTTVTLQCAAEAGAGRPRVWVRYSLSDGQSFLRVDTVYENANGQPIVEDLADAIRADRVFEFGYDAASRLFWAADDWFEQAYGVRVDGYEVKREKLLQLVKDGQSQATIAPGATLTVTRRFLAGPHLLAVKATAAQLDQRDWTPVRFVVHDPAGPVEHAKTTVKIGGAVHGTARTDAGGSVACELPAGPWEVTVEAMGRPPLVQTIPAGAAGDIRLTMAPCGYVVGRITDDAGRPIPCKVAFYDKQQATPFPVNKDGKYDPKLANPYFGPDAGEAAVHNLVYTASGAFRQEIAPGKYEVIVMYGPEYNVYIGELEVAAGKEAVLQAKLVRAVDTAGWVSTDFHSHSSPSGDNVSSQLGRVLNLLGEHIEFAPCTEHARIDTYDAALAKLRASKLLASCPGIELTGSPLPLNHQNAFPLLHKPRTQNGGGPTTDVDPSKQIERLALWDNKSDKLVQQNHPNLQQLLKDKDLDGKEDGGFAGVFGFMDVVEVHPPHEIFEDEKADKPGSNSMRQWMRLLNLGYRIPGVVNTDAHYNFHGSGWLRNYVRSRTDDPAQIKPLDIAHESEAGHVVMTNGPFLEVEAVAMEPAVRPARGISGDIVAAPGGQLQLRIRVQCANWCDVNRVQVFGNGRPIADLNFTRRTHPERFADGVVKFSINLPATFKQDTHLIVATAGEGLTLGRFYGPQFGSAMPVAVSNPIFIDVDGDGFKPNGDMLDLK